MSQHAEQGSSRSKAGRAQEFQEEFAEYEARCNGTRQWHRLSPLHGRLVTTDGIKWLADRAGAYWLVDAVASYQGRLKGEPFQVWRLWREPTAEQAQRAVLEAWNDTPGRPESKRLVRQVIPYTDFPLPEFECWVEDGGPEGTRVLMLKAER